MLQRVHIQILDNPTEGILFDDNTSDSTGTNKVLTDELSKEMNYFYPSVVYVEYIDLFMDGEEEFEDIKELLRLDGLYSKSDTLFEEWAKSRLYFDSAIAPCKKNNPGLCHHARCGCPGWLG